MNSHDSKIIKVSKAMLEQLKRKRIRIVILIIAMLFLGRWFFHMAVEYTIKNYFQDQVTLSAETVVAYKLKDLQIFWLQNKVTLNEVSIDIAQTKNFKDTTNIKLTIPSFTLDLLSIKEVIFEKSLTVEQMVLNNPEIHLFLPVKEDTVLLQKQVGELHQKTLKFLQELKIKNFETRNASLLWSIGSRKTPRYELKNVNILMDDIDLIPENISGEKITELLLNDHLEITLGDNSFLLPDSKNRLNFKQLIISSKEKELLLDGLHLHDVEQKEFEVENSPPNSLLIPSLRLKGIDFLAFYLNNHLLVDSVFVDETHIHLKVDDNTLSLLNTDQKSPNHGLDSIKINHVQLIPSFISVRQNNQSVSNTLKVDSAALTLTNVNYSTKMDSAISWSLENLELHLKKYASKLEQAHYSVNFETLDWSFKEKEFVLEDIQIYPLKDSLIEKQDQIVEYLEIPAISVQDIDFEDLFVHQRLNGGKIKIDSPKIGISLPKKVSSDAPAKTHDIPAEINGFLANFNLKSIQLLKGELSLFQGEKTPFLTLNNLDISGKNLGITDKFSKEINFGIDAAVGDGIFRSPEFKVDFKGVNFSTQKDVLSIQDVFLKPTSRSKGLEGQARLNGVELDGFLTYAEDGIVKFVKIGNAKVDLTIHGNSKNNGLSTGDKTKPVFIDQFSIGNLEAKIQSPGMDTLVMSGLQADLKLIEIGGPNFPFSFDMENSTLKTVQSSVSLAVGKFQFDSLEFNKKNVFIYGSKVVDNDQSEDQLNASIPLISVAGIHLPDSLNQYLGIESVTLQDPKGDFFMAKRSDSIKEKTNSQNSPSESFPVKLDTLQIENANFVLKQDSEEGKSIWKSEKVYLGLFDLRYPYNESEYFMGDLELSLNNFVHQQENIGLQVEKANLSSKDKLVKLTNTKLEKSEFSEMITGTNIDLDIPEIIIRTEMVFNFGQELNISEILVDNPKLSIKGKLGGGDTTAINEKKEKRDFPISSLYLQNFGVKNMNIELEIPEDNMDVWFEGFNFNYNDFYWDSKDLLEIEDFAASGDWTMGLDKGMATFSNEGKKAEISDLRISGPSSEISWGTVDFKTSSGPVSYSSFLTHQETWIGVETGYGRVSGIDWKALSDAGVKAQKIRIDELKLFAYRDQRLPFPENHFPPMLHKALVSSSIPVSIDTVSVNDGNIHVETQPPSGEKTGTIEFSKVNATLTNITNLPKEIKVNNKLNMKATAMIQDEGKLTNDIDFSLDDPNYSFFMDVSLGKMDLRALNSLIEPLASVRIKKGKMRKMEIKAIGNEDYAYGNLDFLYRKLSISILDKKEHDHQNVGHAIESFLANELIIRRNNDHPFPHRQGQLFFIRDKTKSIFNYFAKISLSGILTSVGVKRNRKMIKQKHEEELKILESKIRNESKVSSDN